MKMAISFLSSSFRFGIKAEILTTATMESYDALSSSEFTVSPSVNRGTSPPEAARSRSRLKAGED